MTWHKPPSRVRQWEGPTPTARVVPERIADHKARLVVPLPKEAPARSERYLRAVAALPCSHCGRVGRSQAAHSDSGGKGMGIKSDDRTAIPLCADEPGRNGCHWLIGTSGKFTREQRRHIERVSGVETRAAITSAGAWPADLPAWPEVLA